MDKISSYLRSDREGRNLTGGNVNKIEGLEDGYYVEPTFSVAQ